MLAPAGLLAPPQAVAKTNLTTVAFPCGTGLSGGGEAMAAWVTQVRRATPPLLTP